MNLNDLKKEMPFKWRVQSTNQYGSNCVAYIDARDVQDLLDDVVGAENWQVKYSEHKGNLFASIGIKQDANKFSYDATPNNIYDVPEYWVWKSDCGTESQVEKQKGEASDAFKRAAVMWGIGRFLYSLGIIKIKEVIQKNNKYYPAHNGQQIWDINKHCNNLRSSKPKPTPPKPVINIERLKTRLEACKTVEELGKTYKSFTPAEQKATSKITTAIKQLIKSELI